jgi:CDP-diacylglycerol--serine O-phosphatidyltransferase
MSDSSEPPISRFEMPKVYLLPNLMTAGNLFCGFMAILQIIQGTIEHENEMAGWTARYHMSLRFILAAFIFDMLDGRLARLGGRESAFGREFDSLADVVSFGLAPALLVFKIILLDLPQGYAWMGWFIAFIYLVAGAMRLARFNIVSTQPQGNTTKDFVGFPIPAAAGLVASITLLMLTFYEKEKDIGKWKLLLPFLLIFLSFMMYSQITYPSFKRVDWKARLTIPQVIIAIMIVMLIAKTWEYSLAFVFLTYLLYGFFRPFISKRIRKEIEEEEENET